MERKRLFSGWILAVGFFVTPFFSFSQQTAPTGKRTVKVAMIQMNVVGNDVDANLATAEKLVAKAAAQGAQVAILPECMDIGWTHPGSLINASAIPGGKVYTRL